MKFKTSLFIRFINLIKPLRLSLNGISDYIWYNYPFGNKPSGSKEDYLKLAEHVKTQKYPEINAYEENLGISIDFSWLDRLALQTQITIKKSKLCYAHGRILYSTLSDYLKKRSKELHNEKIFILETGTARGFSAICMAKALADNQKNGLVLTYDVLPHSTKMYWNSINDLINGPQTRSQLLENWKNLCQKYILFHQGDTRVELKKIYSERVHFAFLDGSHTYNDVIYEFNQIKDKQETGDIIIYDDYSKNKFPGIVKAVDEICHKNNYKKNIIESISDRGYVIAIKN